VRDLVVFVELQTPEPQVTTIAVETWQMKTLIYEALAGGVVAVRETKLKQHSQLPGGQEERSN
jgi:hypothetical protein